MLHHLRQALVALVLTVAVAGCGSNEGGDPESTGVRRRAVELLRDYGLSAEQAGCVVDEMGADTVAATSDMDVLATGQEYRDAARACIR